MALKILEQDLAAQLLRAVAQGRTQHCRIIDHRRQGATEHCNRAGKHKCRLVARGQRLCTRGFQQQQHRIEVDAPTELILLLGQAAGDAGKMKYDIHRCFERLRDHTGIADAADQATRLGDFRALECKIQQRQLQGWKRGCRLQ